jgi:hypothetical protein
MCQTKLNVCDDGTYAKIRKTIVFTRLRTLFLLYYLLCMTMNAGFVYVSRSYSKIYVLFILGREAYREAAKSDPMGAGEHSELHATLLNSHVQYIRPL